MKILNRLICLIAIMMASWASAPLMAAEQDPHAQDREQLRSILEESQRGINTQNITLFTQHIDTDARVTFLNGEVAIGPQGVQDYFKRMVGDDANAVLRQYTTTAQVSDGARFYGDVAVANGTMHDVFTPKARGVFAFDSVWSATFAKKEGAWKIVSLHFSTNAFNNALTEELQRKIWQAAIVAALAVVLGIRLYARFFSRKSASR